MNLVEEDPLDGRGVILRVCDLGLVLARRFTVTGSAVSLVGEISMTVNPISAIFSISDKWGRLKVGIRPLLPVRSR